MNGQSVRKRLTRQDLDITDPSSIIITESTINNNKNARPAIGSALEALTDNAGRPAKRRKDSAKTPSAANGNSDKCQEKPVSYNRIRSLTACNTCRRKKIKCDNIRPICGSCQSLKSAAPSNFHGCYYDDSKKDYSAFDRGTLEILDNLFSIQANTNSRAAEMTDIAEKLSQLQSSVNTILSSRVQETVNIQSQSAATLPSPCTISGETSDSHNNKSLANMLVEKYMASGNWDASPESILRWPELSRRLLLKPKKIAILLNRRQGSTYFDKLKATRNLSVLDSPLLSSCSQVSFNSFSPESASPLRSGPTGGNDANLFCCDPKNLQVFEKQLFDRISILFGEEFVVRVYPQIPFIDLRKLKDAVNSLAKAYVNFKEEAGSSEKCFFQESCLNVNLSVPLSFVLVCFALSTICKNTSTNLVLSSGDDFSNNADFQLGIKAFKLGIRLSEVQKDSLLGSEYHYNSGLQCSTPNSLYLNLGVPAAHNQIDSTLNRPLWDIQLHLLSFCLCMALLKPLDAWSCLQKASSAIMMYNETKNISFRLIDATEESLTVSQLFWICYKYESQIKSYLSPFFVGSGILHYQNMPRMLSRDFYGHDYIIDSAKYTEIHLIDSLDSSISKAETDILDVFYSSSAGDFSMEQRWGKFDLPFLEARISYFKNRIGAPVQAIQLGHLKLQILSTVHQNPGLLDSIKCIRWKIASLKSKLYRPVLYYLIHDLSFANQKGQLATKLMPVFIRDSLESLTKSSFFLCDTCNDTTRSKDTWFRLRDMYTSAITLALIYDLFPDIFCIKDTVACCLDKTVQTFNFWKNECPEFGVFVENLDRLRDVFLNGH